MKEFEMRLLIASLVLAMFFTLLGTAKDLSNLAEDMRQSITRLRMTGPALRWGTCSAFAINKDRGWGLTAEPCVVTVDGFEYRVIDEPSRPISVVARSSAIFPPQPDDDLALVQGDIFRELPALTAMLVIPDVGDIVAAYGFALGRRTPYFYTSNVARTRPRLFSFEISGPVMHGMSGSPMVNEKGLVVGVIVKGTPSNTYVIGSWHFQELYKHALKEHTK